MKTLNPAYTLYPYTEYPFRASAQFTPTTRYYRNLFSAQAYVRRYGGGCVYYPANGGTALYVHAKRATRANVWDALLIGGQAPTEAEVIAVTRYLNGPRICSRYDRMTDAERYYASRDLVSALRPRLGANLRLPPEPLLDDQGT